MKKVFGYTRTLSALVVLGGLTSCIGGAYYLFVSKLEIVAVNRSGREITDLQIVLHPSYAIPPENPVFPDNWDLVSSRLADSESVGLARRAIVLTYPEEWYAHPGLKFKLDEIEVVLIGVGTTFNPAWSENATIEFYENEDPNSLNGLAPYTKRQDYSREKTAEYVHEILAERAQVREFLEHKGLDESTLFYDISPDNKYISFRTYTEGISSYSAELVVSRELLIWLTVTR